MVHATRRDQRIRIAYSGDTGSVKRNQITDLELCQPPILR